ncbi:MULTISPECIES: DEAD/DEAH box helicase [Burkholderia]|uniref:DEAD/DEAH box helicase n=1 Tax=Burkholderia TaxID=32008 RepID=UPI0021C014C9|nr:DEAD/DEAH box helicase [Burkholderia multivorans]MCA8225097.1 DEAD/DEAH box helicase [Burkholderia multivorans]MDR9049108.1 hypothetical protein [Burkholderia multivorans]MDR9057023.1 hypothetical protein [Burkholderia multivorans]MDR9060784.1 hypothetical protein [Burkholderia multivorans]MDR9073820.1 hypothetical protein [Burkholderia multivorans]
MATSETLRSVERAHAEAQKRRIYETFGLSLRDEVRDELASVIAELAVLDAMGPNQLAPELRNRAAKSYLLLKDERPDDEPPEDHLTWLLRTATLAIIADRPAEARRFLRTEMASISAPREHWLPYVRQSVAFAWVGLLRKDGRDDIDATVSIIASLRAQQKAYESRWLQGRGTREQKSAALELVGLYNLASAADRMASYTITGRSEGASDIGAQTDMQFERAIEAFERARSLDLLDVGILLHAAAKQLIANSVRTAVRGANSLTQRFANYLVNRPHNPIFELLPPQRAALAEEGLISTARRSIVVNLPTSSGKTLIAEFSILQAINDLGSSKGFVAYIAPTRALVNQISAKLRHDFGELGLRVERLSPALEFDSIEAAILDAESAENSEPPVNVLVCTPEKFDLLMRRDDIRDKLGVLALVVVDEAHNVGGSDDRAIKLELLLAMLNREHRDARFLLLTPFIKNAKEVATWLDQVNYQDYSIAADWVPNDRVVGLALPPRDKAKRGKLLEDIQFRTLHTPRRTLFVDEVVTLPGVSPLLGLTESVSKTAVNKLAVATTQVLSTRGPTVLLCGRVDATWDAAKTLAMYFDNLGEQSNTRRALAARFVEYELGKDFPLADYINVGVAVHHSGLPEEVAQFIELLFSERQLHTLCSTTTLAQGVNFPISNLVLATISQPYKSKMDYSEFWNIAGRVGRVDQEAVGVVALASSTQEQQTKHEKFVSEALENLASRLLAMAQKLYDERALKGLRDFVWQPEWSAFAQFITHTFRRVGPVKFADELELILRGTLGYKALRENNTVLARHLLIQTQQYAQGFASDMGAVKLVDSTGFSIESVRRALSDLAQVHAPESLLSGSLLFNGKNRTLKEVMGILLKIPEIRENLEFGKGSDGSKLAFMVADWVNGRPIPDIAKEYFEGETDVEKITECMRNVKKISTSASWGLASLISMKFGTSLESMSDEQRREAANVPSMALYGVNRDSAIALRSAGVPRNAALGLAARSSLGQGGSVYRLREELKGSRETWASALGKQRGADYHQVWSMLEGV